MLATMLKQGVAAVMGLTLAAPGGAVVVAPPQEAQVIDGNANAATCLQYGFDLKRRGDADSLRMQMVAPSVGMAGPPPPPPSAPPPPSPMYAESRA